MRLLVSVRDPHEARLAAAAGADFVDCKEPAAGALGALAPTTIAAVVRTLAAQRFDGATSATIGDWPATALPQVLARVAQVAATGIGFVKVGVESGPAAPALLQALAGCGHAVVPVFVADRGLDAALTQRALDLSFPALMADTADKRSGSLFDAVPAAELAAFVAAARAAGVPVGLAGALRSADLPRLLALAPDFAGFRSAVCAGDRAGTLDAARVQALAQALGRPAALAAAG
ncbi:hypothetical protein CKO44_02455 [Rubrivivax gelatinosus]|uniref:(5-formylfuran-3-yl)methyl phosphate synthase n=1 Tax=Rubrivivax gelatinosus TaxID=28068 RepID=A0ABS1DY02_RUBGE|nr:(5-formylfuran-3-yl)methyl phosphate synthase [Rubrivivax gelatinosus]MBK1612326.1 hypothetical protein [Rubrivivax gelatinosus]MBK1714967.1 hypothetical protein [Rubrivivax gelatinosus]